ncbi:MAG: transposase [Patescibacteria group bacterium]
MTIQRPELVNDEIYHVVSRTVGDTVVFDNEKDFYRGIFSIYEFNTKTSITIRERRRLRDQFKKDNKVYRRMTSANTLWIDKRDRLVEVLAFSFMPNHLHLILKQIKDNGITEFMKKVNGGYAKYFNEKYNRKGHLFSRFRAIHIKTDEQLKNTFVYVHTNLISLIEPGWKEKGIKNPKKVKEFLTNNKRHSYPDYLGKKNFSSVSERDFLLKIMNGAEGCKNAVDNWIIYKREMKNFSENFSDVALE